MNFILFLEQQWLLITLLFGLLSLWYLLEKRHSIGVFEPQQIVIALNNNQYTAIDIRPASTYAEGHVANSLNIPYKDPHCVEKITQQQQKGRKLLLICDRGMQSKALAGSLTAKQLECVTIAGGLEAWKSQGFPLRSHSDDKKNKRKSTSGQSVTRQAAIRSKTVSTKQKK